MTLIALTGCIYNGCRRFLASNYDKTVRNQGDTLSFFSRTNFDPVVNEGGRANKNVLLYPLSRNFAQKNCAYISEYHHGFSTVDITAKSSRCYANFASSQRLCNASMGIIVIHFFTPPPRSPQMKRGEGKYLHSPRAINGYTQKSPGKSPHWDSEMDPPYFAYVRCVSSGSF